MVISSQSVAFHSPPRNNQRILLIYLEEVSVWSVWGMCMSEGTWEARGPGARL